MFRGVLLTILAVSLLAGCSDSHGPPVAAPIHHLQISRVSYRGDLLSLTVDSVHGMAYGSDADGIFALDERGHLRRIIHLPKREYACDLVVDPSDDRLITGDFRVDHLPISHTSEKGLRETVLSREFDLGSRRLIGTVTVSHYVGDCSLGSPTVLAVDSSVHHAFMEDLRGRGVMIDTASGRLIRTFHTIPPWSSFGPLPKTSVVDPATHRLFISVLSTNSRGGQPPYLMVLDTRDGKNVRTDDGPPSLGHLVMDDADNRIFASDAFAGLAVFDARSGHPIQASRGERYPWVTNNVAADGLTHRAFVSRYRGDKPRGTTSIATTNALTLNVIRRLPLRGASDQTPILVDPSMSRAYVFTPGSIWAVNAQSGRLLQRISVRKLVANQKDGYNVAIDPVHHRLFVYGDYGIDILRVTS